MGDELAGRDRLIATLQAELASLEEQVPENLHSAKLFLG